MTYKTALNMVRENKTKHKVKYTSIYNELGICTQTIFRWYGGRNVMRADTFLKLTKAVGCDLILTKDSMEYRPETYEELIELLRNEKKKSKITGCTVAQEMKKCICTISKWMNASSTMKTDDLLQLIKIIGFDSDIGERKKEQTE